MFNFFNIVKKNQKIFLGVTKQDGSVSISLPLNDTICIESLFYKDTCFKFNQDSFFLLQNVFLLNQITVSEKANSIDLLWSNLQYNKNQFIKDTSIFYFIDFTISIPDSNWEENINGVLQIYMELSGKIKSFLCNCNYSEKGKIGEKTYMHLLGISPSKLFESYNILSVFKNKYQLRKYEIKSNWLNNKFILKKDNKNFSSSTQINFKKKNLINSYSQTFYYRKFLKYQIIYQKTVFAFLNKNGILFPELINYLNSYTYDNILVNTSLVLKSIKKPQFCKKVKLLSTKPQYIFDNFKKK